ncbi:MAG TPA: RHS repeat-associated core domain-containing protein, partial [Bryobacteraceae bacterium]|nr:RHS repeat-associated core domain-containing protein [Bryobacteraceae bacterium]
TGLDYADQRYYQPGMGRFLTADPYMANNGGSGEPSDPGSWNRFAYVGGDPVNLTDPDGRFAHCPDGTHSNGSVCLIDDPGPPPFNKTLPKPVVHPSPPKPQGPGPDPCQASRYANAIGFVHAHEGDAERLANVTGIPVDFIMALAAGETGWTGSDVSSGNNNYFNDRLPKGTPKRPVDYSTATGGWAGAVACSSLGHAYDPGWACFAPGDPFYSSGFAALMTPEKGLNGGTYGGVVAQMLSYGATWAEAAEAMAQAGFDREDDGYSKRFQGALSVYELIKDCP